MLSHANTLLIDSPTIHLDLEAIQSVNKGLEEFKGSIIVSSHDHKLLETVCNKVIEVGDLGSYTYEGSFDEYIDNQDIKQKRTALYIN
jgi:ATPase subunit of ABC transporter with duplicated ATPase domains